MNINTSTLLNILSPKMDKVLKEKVESLSTDGKVNLSALVKDKNISSLISGLMSELSSGLKTKGDISTLLLNNKNSFSFKNLADDIKILTKALQSDQSNSKVAQQLNVLKESLVDMKNIDSKVLKDNISNSGVFLESKLLKESIPLSKNIEQLITLVKNQLTLLTSSIEQMQSSMIQSNEQVLAKSDIPKDIKLEVKNAIEGILRQIKTISTNTSNVEQKQTMTKVEADIKSLQSKLDTYGIKNDITNNLKELLSNVKDQLGNKNIENIKQSLQFIQEKVATLKMDLSSTLKSDFQKISSSLESLEQSKSPLETKGKLDSVLINLKNINSEINKLSTQVILEKNIGITKNISSDMKTAILQIQEHIETSKEPVSKEIKAIVEKIASQIEFFQLQSYSTNSSHSYISFLQDNIDDVDIKFTPSTEEGFSCQINLKMKEYGDIKVLLMLDNKNNININLGVEDNYFKEMLQEKLQLLRVRINSIGLSLQSLNVFDIDNNSNKPKSDVSKFTQNDNLSFGLDIKA